MLLVENVHTDKQPNITEIITSFVKVINFIINVLSSGAKKQSQTHPSIFFYSLFLNHMYTTK